MQTLEFTITGMNCASCVAHVEKALLSVEGVEDARVNLTTNRAAVEGQGLVADSLSQSVKRAGFAAEVIDIDRDDSPSPQENHDHKTASSNHIARNPRATAMRRAMMTLPVVLLVMWAQMTGQGGVWVWVQLIITSILMASLLGLPFFRGALRGARYGRMDMDTLIALGSGVAFVASVVVMVAGSDGPTHFGTALAILWFITLGHALEHKARQSAASALHGLRQLAPDTATVIQAGKEIQTPIEQIRVGQTILIKPGGALPLDGTITSGESTIDQSMVTGESEPVEVTAGDEIYAGTINQTGSLRFTVTAIGAKTLLGQIATMVEQAQTAKANVQRMADKVAGVFVPAVIAVAVMTLLGWGLLMQDSGGWSAGVSNMVAVLIVACPCALGLAVPTAILVGTGIGARQGILIKSPAALERSGKLTHILLDKTGTLTTGKPTVTNIVSCDEAISEDELLRLAAAAEQDSEHPIGKALVQTARDREITLPTISLFESITAAGVRASVEGKIVAVGRPSLLKEHKIDIPEVFERAIDEHSRRARTIIAVSIDNKAIGFFGLADQLRPEAEETVKELKALGLTVMMITGDSQRAADGVAKRLGITRTLAEVRPGDKQNEVKRLQQMGKRVAMVGDGINDAPALAEADIGIAIGGGTDIARDAGHVVLVGSDLRQLPATVRLSRAMMQRIIFGLLWASIYNIFLIPLAALGIIQPMFAALAMSLSSVSVVLNALWLRWRWKG